jgi:hypothetical protein
MSARRSHLPATLPTPDMPNHENSELGLPVTPGLRPWSSVPVAPHSGSAESSPVRSEREGPEPHSFLVGLTGLFVIAPSLICLAGALGGGALGFILAWALWACVWLGMLFPTGRMLLSVLQQRLAIGESAAVVVSVLICAACGITSAVFSWNIYN